MAQVLPIGPRRAKATAPARFDRAELIRLLALYAERVAGGEWRDYAIGQRPGSAEFSVYRHTLENPLFTIRKFTDGGADRWEVASGPRKLHRGESLDEVLSIFQRSLRLAH